MNKAQFIYGGRTYSVSWPSSFEEMTEKHLLQFCRCLSRDWSHRKMLRSLLYRWLKVPMNVFRHMKAAELNDFFPTLNYLFDKQSKSRRLIIPYTHKGMLLLHGPGEEWRDLTVEEFIYVDACAAAYQKTRHEIHLNCIVAALYRPSSIGSLVRNYFSESDLRCRFNDRKAAARARNLSVNPYVKQAIYLNYQLYRRQIETDNEFLFQQEESGKQGFGWVGVMKNIAGAELGTFEKICKMTMNNALIHLNKMEADRQAVQEIVNNKTGSTRIF